MYGAPAVTTAFPSSTDVLREHDRALVVAIRAGDRAAEEALFRKHAADVLNLATRLLRSREDAREVVQETFVTAFEEMPALRDPSAAGGWLRTIAVRLVHRRFRRRRLLRALGLDRTEEDVPLEAQADERASLEARLELARLDRAMDRLPGAEKIAWMLRHVEGLALEEVADTCKCSLATAKRRIGAAQALVDRHIQPERGER